MNLGKLLLRLVVGGLFVGHGLQKLRGSFGGPGLDGATQMMGALNMHPPRRNAVAAAVTETAGGAAIALGVATPFAAAGLIATMLTAVRKVHLANGLWNSGGGYEYNAVLMAAVTALADDGPGTISFDALIGKSRWGLGWGLFAIVAGVVGSTGAIELGRRSAPAVSTDDADQGATPESTDAAI
ncbi:DoxX family protein [uncultured Amnibacterium sp.]|uniref:DoxX family protein n=1 Tax=uncultured Amnibacterium sp. TaxID=1631851 RepID=UPI0035C9FC9F